MSTTYSYGFWHQGHLVTVDSGAPSREEALADIQQYLTNTFREEFAPKQLCELVPERIIN